MTYMIVLSLVTLGFVALIIVFFIKYQHIKTKYADIIDIDETLNQRKEDVNKIVNEIISLKSSYAAKHKTYRALENAISMFQEELDFARVGLYNPHFDYDSSPRYKIEMNDNYEAQKLIIKNNKAVVCRIEWAVDGSKSEGKKMTDRNIKLILRAFNGECDAAIAKVSWNNVDKMESRMLKAFTDLNNLSEPNKIYITNEFFNVKLKELYLTHEYALKRQEEKEEQRRIQDQIREEQKAQKEFEIAQAKAEREEHIHQKALDQARIEYEKAREEDKSIYAEKISILEQKVKDAEEARQRAISQAQLTKSGHVYVISNIGSFGENVYKIGMTRRMEPQNRIDELGSASVPFGFDVHAMISSNDAPSLETILHNIFKDRRVNVVNFRKEFFNVTLDEIEKAVIENHGTVAFTKLAEARDYRETLSIKRNKEKSANMSNEREYELPKEL